MSTDPTTGDVPPPPPATPPPPKGIWRRWLIRSVAVVLLLLAADEIGSRLVPSDTVQVTLVAPANLEGYGGGTSTTTRTITNAATVADLYARINRLPIGMPSQDLASEVGCGPIPMMVVVRFTRWGLPIETATTPYGDLLCGAWSVSHGRIPDLFPLLPPSKTCR